MTRIATGRGRTSSPNLTPTTQQSKPPTLTTSPTRIELLTGQQKARRIQDALRTVREQTGGSYTMEFIEPMEVDEALAWLTDIRGIGPKTAGIVLLFRFDKPYFPVDTHCERLAKRFELIPADASYERAHELLTERVPADIHYSFHRLLLDHGRAYCTARNPRCQETPVCRDYCCCDSCAGEQSG